jgi:hypothetical protein
MIRWVEGDLVGLGNTFNHGYFTRRVEGRIRYDRVGLG